MIYLGIDSGLRGGLVAISDQPGVAPIAMCTMPIQATSKGNEVNAVALWQWINLSHLLEQGDGLTAILETPGKHSPGAQALCSMWDSYGVIRGVLSVKGVKLVRVTPGQWQKKMLPGCKKGDTKPFALTIARQIWPGESFLASPRCSVPHDGLVDGALLAEHGRRERL